MRRAIPHEATAVTNPGSCGIARLVGLGSLETAHRGYTTVIYTHGESRMLTMAFALLAAGFHSWHLVKREKETARDSESADQTDRHTDSRQMRHIQTD